MKYLSIIIILSAAIINSAHAQNTNRDTQPKSIDKPDSTAKSASQKEKIFYYVEQMPAPPYNMDEYIAAHIKYPASAMKHNVQEKVKIGFTVNTDGSISDCKVIESLDEDCDEEALRVIKNMPRWKPGMQEGKPIKVNFIKPINFGIADKRNNLPANGEPEAGYDINRYISEHLHYPKKAWLHNITGVVRVQFTVNENGNIEDCKVESGIGGGCDEEALRIISKMPQWLSPARKDGRKIKTTLVQSVKFSLD